MPSITPITTASASALTRSPKTMARVTIKVSPIIPVARFIKKISLSKLTFAVDDLAPGDCQPDLSIFDLHRLNLEDVPVKDNKISICTGADAAYGILPAFGIGGPDCVGGDGLGHG